ncbi:MAG: SDR family NAD(P)-dependent oxidoreductase [Haliangiales bacterium]
MSDPQPISNDDTNGNGDSSDSRPLAGQHALVTGGGRGIGAAIAETLTHAGAAVTVAGRDLGRAQAAAQALADSGHQTHAIAMDVTDEAAIERGFASAQAALGPVDILVNNAGAADSAPFTRLDRDHWDRMLAVNLTAVYSCCRAALPAMLERKRGRVVNIASTAGLRGYGYVAAYVAAKHGVIGLTRSLALETARAGVTVNAVCPGYTDTDMTRATIANIEAKTGRSAQEARAALVKDSPQRRLIEPDEVASAVLWLCLPGARGVTGQAVAVAGGEVM